MYSECKPRETDQLLRISRATEMALWLRARAVPVDLVSIRSTHMLVHNHLQLQF